jgi:hypothetical protein
MFGDLTILRFGGECGPADFLFSEPSVMIGMVKSTVICS